MATLIGHPSDHVNNFLVLCGYRGGSDHNRHLLYRGGRGYTSVLGYGTTTLITDNAGRLGGVENREKGQMITRGTL